MIELKMKGNQVSDSAAENGAGADQVEVRTDLSAHFETRHDWNIGIINAATEIKAGLFHIMASALPELVKCSGETPKVVAQIMCGTIGCDIREFREYVDPALKV